MQMYFEPSGHSGKTQSLTVISDTAKLSEAKGSPAALATESGEASLSIPSLHAPEKSLKGIVHPLQGPTLQVHRQLAHVVQFVSALGQRLALLNIRACLARFAITVDTLLKRCVV
jgi:hypothetical protein